MNRSECLARLRQCGFSLIEVLVALLVLSIGLLGLAALQTTSLKYNTDSYTRTQATLLAYDIIDRMRANTKGLSAGKYDVRTQAAASAKKSAYSSCKAGNCACDLNACDSDNLATYDLGKWYERMKILLPDSSITGKLATIQTPAGGAVTIKIQWKEHDQDKQQQWEVQL